MKLRTTVQISSAIAPKKPTLKREDSFLKRFSTRQIPETQVGFHALNVFLVEEFTQISKYLNSPPFHFLCRKLLKTPAPKDPIPTKSFGEKGAMQNRHEQWSIQTRTFISIGYWCLQHVSYIICGH